MAIAGASAAQVAYTGKKQSQAASKRASRPKRVHHTYNPPRRRNPQHAYASQPAYRPRSSGTVSRSPKQVRSRPILPVPSADAIADLFNSIAGYNREYGQLGANATAQKGQLGAARGLYLKQLQDTFNQTRTSTLEDFASRGLSDSGIANEAIAKLFNTYTGQQSEYETNYRSSLADIMRTLQGRRADIHAQRTAAERRYNQLRAQRAAALRSAGFGG